MRYLIDDYYLKIQGLMEAVEASNKQGENIDFPDAMSLAVGLIKNQTRRGGKLIFIGNGASAAIASHQATDFWKNGRMPAMAFNDASLLTCVSNDFGYRHVFEKPIEMFGASGDILVAISSSGKSENILRAVWAAKKKKVRVVTLSGFKKNNPLKRAGEINFYVPSSSYGHVEIMHHSICHCWLDTIIKTNSLSKRQYLK